MRYRLTKLTPAQTLSQIAAVTQGFYCMSANSADWVQRDVRSREFSSFASLPAPPNTEILAAILGENNYYLDLTMKSHRIDWLCHNADKEEFQFWGEYQACIKAMNELRFRICKVTARMEKKSVTEESSSVPSWKWSREAEPIGKDMTPPCPSSPTYSPTSPSYNPTSPVFDAPSFDLGRWGEQPAGDVEDYSPVAKAAMEKMGFVLGQGLGANNTGRLNPINAVSDLGGRPSNERSGLGFKEEEEDQQSTASESEPPVVICIHNYTQYYDQEKDRIPSEFAPCKCEEKNKKPKKNKNMRECFRHGQQIRHTIINCNHTWTGSYSSVDNTIFCEGLSYKSLSGFASRHYAKERPDRTPNANGWDECQAEVNGEWVPVESLRR
jgi:hypothetical protein